MTSQISRNIVKSSHQNYILYFVLNFGKQGAVFIWFSVTIFFFKLTAGNCAINQLCNHFDYVLYSFERYQMFSDHFLLTEQNLLVHIS